MWPPTITPCECEQPGWCERHHCWKSPGMHLLCRRQMRQFQAWEEGRGPCLPPPADAVIDVTTADANESPDQQPVRPGLAQRAINFGKAVVRHAVDRGRQVSDSDYESRLTVCRSCSLCDLEKMVCNHPGCGCFLNIKARWHSEKCPIDKWQDLPGNTPEEQ